MNFGEALEAIKNEKKVAREGWNGKGMYLYKEDFDVDRVDGLGFEVCIVMYNAEKKFQPGWLPSQPDLFAEDWQIIE